MHHVSVSCPMPLSASRARPPFFFLGYGNVFFFFFYVDGSMNEMVVGDG